MPTARDDTATRKVVPAQDGSGISRRVIRVIRKSRISGASA